MAPLALLLLLLLRWWWRPSRHVCAQGAQSTVSFSFFFFRLLRLRRYCSPACRAGPWQRQSSRRCRCLGLRPPPARATVLDVRCYGRRVLSRARKMAGPSLSSPGSSTSAASSAAASRNTCDALLPLRCVHHHHHHHHWPLSRAAKHAARPLRRRLRSRV